MYKWNLIIYDKNRIMKVMIYIISLCNKIHGGEIYMFQNERFCTCGVNKEVPIVDTMEVESKDYFQVFELSEYDGMQKIVHSQEMPEYKMEYLVKLQGAPIFVGKIYVIDDKTHSTMLKAEEY